MARGHLLPPELPMSGPSLRPLIAAWNRFWFEPKASSTLALVRIAFGLVIIYEVWLQFSRGWIKLD